MRFDHPDAVVDDFFAGQAHTLQAGGGVEANGGAGVRASHLLDETTEHRVARAGIRVESNSLLQGFTIEESELFGVVVRLEIV